MRELIVCMYMYRDVKTFLVCNSVGSPAHGALLIIRNADAPEHAGPCCGSGLYLPTGEGRRQITFWLTSVVIRISLKRRTLRPRASSTIEQAFKVRAYLQSVPSSLPIRLSLQILVQCSTTMTVSADSCEASQPPCSLDDTKESASTELEGTQVPGVIYSSSVDQQSHVVTLQICRAWYQAA